jgi:hypothetical protein
MYSSSPKKLCSPSFFPKYLSDRYMRFSFCICGRKDLRFAAGSMPVHRDEYARWHVWRCAPEMH